MGPSLVTIITLLYIGTAIAELGDGRIGLGLTFLCYALANVGLILAMKGF
jgi:hypothetical protein